ncbi:hypothetical protein GCM10009801_45740 [Streptomyces albiaxialis]|uniref:Integral membrane protein n=1 Tax=Streptomyces albiaxialis TaxID=329523 RepID=A0ABN2W6C3_9ACTN
MNERMAHADQFRSPWAPPPAVQVAHWDLEHELAQILQDAAAHEETIPQDPVPGDPAYDPAFAHAFDPAYDPPGSPRHPHSPPDPRAEPEPEPVGERTPHRRVRGPGHHRRVRRRITVAMVRNSISFAATGALLVIFVTVSLLSGMVTTGPLRRLVEPVVGDFSDWWPLLIQGPWVAAVLSILRTRTVRGQHALVAWSVLILFSAVTVVLYVTQVPRNPVAVVIGMLPPVAALACLKLLTPHLMPGNARHAGTGGAKTAPRKRGRKS